MPNLYPLDYSKWERSTNAKPLLWTPHQKGITSSFEQIKRQDSRTVIRQPQTGISGKSQQNTVHSDAAGFPKLTRRRTAGEEHEQITGKRDHNSRTLMVLIMCRKKAIKNLEELCEQLSEKNLQIARDIMDTERNTVSRARELLTQQERMRRSLAAFKRWGDTQTGQVKAEMTDLEKASHLHGLQEQLGIVKAKVENAKKELRTLRTYKDMEYPVKALQIADMERELDRLRKLQQDEEEDVNILFEKEMVNLERCQRQRQQEVMSAIVEKHASQIPPIVKLMASHNHTMREEIHVHRKAIIELEKKNKELIKSIQDLQLSRPNVRREIFPDVFLKLDKCTPDMDVHLSIPQDNLLPM